MLKLPTTTIFAMIIFPAANRAVTLCWHGLTFSAIALCAAMTPHPLYTLIARL
jgi:hypothetical protein